MVCASRHSYFCLFVSTRLRPPYFSFARHDPYPGLSFNMLRSSAAHITAVLTLCDILVHCYVPMAPRQATISSLSAGTTTANALQNCPTDPPYVRFATFGDSYASGVTYGSGCVSGHCDGRPDRDYDYGDAEMIRQCRRIIDAYAYQTKNDCSWSNGASPYLDWPACSGSRFGAISDDGGQASTLFNSQQSAGSANISNFATLQIGGNDAGFFDVVSTYVGQCPSVPFASTTDHKAH